MWPRNLATRPDAGLRLRPVGAERMRRRVPEAPASGGWRESRQTGSRCHLGRGVASAMWPSPTHERTGVIPPFGGANCPGGACPLQSPLGPSSLSPPPSARLLTHPLQLRSRFPLFRSVEEPLGVMPHRKGSSPKS